MKSEYVKLSVAERTYGQQNLLQSQLELLDSISRMKKYKQLRSEELILKISLKNKLTMALESLKKLDKSLPHTHFTDLTPKKPKKVEKKGARNLSLHEEMGRIKSKLEKLQKEM